jgi:hypothetical protein
MKNARWHSKLHTVALGWCSNERTVLDAHGNAGDGEADRADGAQQVQAAQAVDGRQLRQEQLRSRQAGIGQESAGLAVALSGSTAAAVVGNVAAHEHFLSILKGQGGHTCMAPKMMMKCCSVMLPFGSYSLYIDCRRQRPKVSTGSNTGQRG